MKYVWRGETTESEDRGQQRPAEGETDRQTHRGTDNENKRERESVVRGQTVECMFSVTQL